jgi:carbamate kinase
MANSLGIDTLMILTAVKRVAVDWGRPEERPLERVTLRELKAHRANGQFPAGSMGPKVDAAIRFLEDGGERVIIGHIDDAMAALEGRAGTLVLSDDHADAGQAYEG